MFIKQFVKSLSIEGYFFRNLCSKFPKMSEVKLKEVVFTGPDERNVYLIIYFGELLKKKTFKNVVYNFLRTNKYSDYKTIVQLILAAYWSSRMQDELNGLLLTLPYWLFSWKPRSLQWRKRWNISPGCSWYQETLPKKMECQYVSWLLLNAQSRNQRRKSETSSEKIQREGEKFSLSKKKL